MADSTFTNTSPMRTLPLFSRFRKLQAKKCLARHGGLAGTISTVPFIEVSSRSTHLQSMVDLPSRTPIAGFSRSRQPLVQPNGLEPLDTQGYVPPLRHENFFALSSRVRTVVVRDLGTTRSMRSTMATSTCFLPNPSPLCG